MSRESEVRAVVDGLPSCPGATCHGEFRETEIPHEYECDRCGRTLRQSVVSRMDSFKRVAERDCPAAEIARAALEGEQS